VESLRKDLSHGVRLLARQPGFTAVAILSLGLGVGVNTTIFSVVNAVLFKPSAVRDADRLVEIYSGASEDFQFLTSSYPDYLDLRDSTDSFSGMAAHGFVSALLTRGGRSESILGEIVTANYFDVLGARTALGRTFLPEEDRTAGTHPVVILSHGSWQRRLGGDPGVVGKTLKMSGLDYTIVGVAPAEFTGTMPGLEPEFWVPSMMVEQLSVQGIQTTTGTSTGRTRFERRGSRWLFLKGRLAPGRTLQEARAQAETVMARLEMEYPDTNDKVRATLLPARGVRIHPMVDEVLSPAAALLLGAAGLVLLIACANVANMLLSRATARRKEIAVRLALGASRWRLVRQLLTESLVLATLGGLAGLVMAFWASRLLSALLPALPVPLSFAFDLDVRVLSFALAASLGTSLLFGLAPALRASRPDLVPALKDAATGPETLRRRFGFRNVLVVGQLAVSLVLLIAGALLVRGLARASEIDPGFDPDRLVSLSFNLKMNGYSPEQSTAFQRRLVSHLEAQPGIEAVTLVSRPPLGSDINLEGVQILGHHQPDDEDTAIDATQVGPGYFRTVGLTLLEGRDFTAADDEDAPKVVIVNEAMAKRYWPGRSPIGEQIHTDGFDEAPHVIVGLVRDYKVRSLGEAPRPYLHFARRQEPSRNVTVLARTSGPAAHAVAPLRRAVLELEPELAFSEEGTVTDLIRMTLVPTRVGASLIGAFGALALLLAAVGLYGVIAYTVSQRTRELGVRAALGADRGDLVKLVIGQGMKLAVVGVALGVLAAAAVTRVLSVLLYGISAVDPWAFGGAATMLLGVALLANLVPALRAARVDPMRALRHE
jgi:predicted permease